MSDDGKRSNRGEFTAPKRTPPTEIAVTAAQAEQLAGLVPRDWRERLLAEGVTVVVADSDTVVDDDTAVAIADRDDIWDNPVIRYLSDTAAAYNAELVERRSARRNAPKPKPRRSVNDLLVYTPDDLMEVLGLGRSQVYAMLGSGEIPSKRIGPGLKLYRTSRKDLMEYLERPN